MDAASITAIGIIFTGLVTIFLKFVNDNRKSQETRDELFAKALRENTNAVKEGTKAQIRTADEAKERNGHLAEITIQQGDKIIEAVQTLKTQHVKNQVVDKQTVKK